MEIFDSTGQQVENTGMPVGKNLPMTVLIYTNNILYFRYFISFFFVVLYFIPAVEQRNDMMPSTFQPPFFTRPKHEEQKNLPKV